MDEIITHRLILRQWKISDSPDLFEYGKSELVGPNAGWKPHKSVKESKEIIKKFIEGKECYAIVLKSKNKVIGGIGLHNKKPDESFKDLEQREIGYVLNPKYCGNGYIPEAVRLLIDYGFDKLNLDLIWCAHYDFNSNSKRVIEKCGFKYKFKRNEKLKLLDNKEATVLYYNILKSEYNSYKQILKLEKELLKSEVRKSAEKLSNIISDEFVEFTSSGTMYNYKSGDIFQDVKDNNKLNWEIKDFNIKELSRDCLLATYRLTKHDELNKDKKYSLRSSIWECYEGKWKMIFHQGTLSKE